MMKAGIMSEMMDDTLEALDDDEEELEEEAQDEVDKVLWQITDGKLGQANGQVGNLPVRLAFLLFFCFLVLTFLLPQQTTGPTAEEQERDDEMERAIQGLLSS
jgi:charged multivesicular body protein 3